MPKKSFLDIRPGLWNDGGAGELLSCFCNSGYQIISTPQTHAYLRVLGLASTCIADLPGKWEAMEACLKYLSKTEHKLEEATAFASGLTTISELGIDISVCLPFNPLAGVVEDQSRLTLATFATRFSKVAVTDSEDIPYLISCILENRSSDSHILPHEARWFSRKAVIHTRWLQAVLDLSKVSEIRPDRVPAPASM